MYHVVSIGVKIHKHGAQGGAVVVRVLESKSRKEKSICIAFVEWQTNMIQLL